MEVDGQRTVYERFARLKKPARIESWSLAPSTRAGKKWTVNIVPSKQGGRIQVHFGDSTMQDYTQHRDKERRRRFHQRFATLIAQTRNNPLSPMYYSAKLLW